MYRAKQQFREGEIKFEIPSQQQLESRLENVLTSLYLLFNEGYNSTSNDKLIRKDLIEEACRLCFLLTENEQTNLPQVNALLALMLFHAARIDARLDEDDNILLLQQQDRSLWDRELIDEGGKYFERSVAGNHYSVYHLQAAIAFQHMDAPSFSETDWDTIVSIYNVMCQRFPSPVVYLNRAIALSQLQGAEVGIEEIEKIPGKEKLKEYYLLPAALGDLYSNKNDFATAKKYYADALLLTKSQTEKKLLQSKLEKCDVALS
jgi:RNA polymerase sigma-70 factor (ECF subfamily)